MNPIVDSDGRPNCSSTQFLIKGTVGTTLVKRHMHCSFHQRAARRRGASTNDVRPRSRPNSRSPTSTSQSARRMVTLPRYNVTSPPATAGVSPTTASQYPGHLYEATRSSVVIATVGGAMACKFTDFCV